MMKKLLMSAIAVLMIAAPASAQYRRPVNRPVYHPNNYRGAYGSIHNDNSTYFGLRVGLGLSTVNSDAEYLDGSDAKTGVNLGVAIGTRLTYTAPIFIESGLYYTEKGGKSTIDGNKFTYGLNYLEVPLLFKYKAPVARDVTIEPFVGGYVACGVGGKIKDFHHRAAYGSFDEDFDDNFNRFDGGLRIGCGASFNVAYLEASYDIGLANVGKDNFDDTRTGCFNLTVGVNF